MSVSSRSDSGLPLVVSGTLCQVVYLVHLMVAVTPLLMRMVVGPPHLHSLWRSAQIRLLGYSLYACMITHRTCHLSVVLCAADQRVVPHKCGLSVETCHVSVAPIFHK